MEIKIRTQSTPNPYALKFVSNVTFKSSGKATFSSPEECHHIPLALRLMQTPNVMQIHFFENSMTLTQNGITAWDDLSETVQRIIREEIPNHDPEFKSAEEQRRANLPEELLEVEQILDQTIRPSLQMDGGDIEVLSLDGVTLSVRYEGACGSCPSSTGATLEAIQGILRERFNENIIVQPV